MKKINYLSALFVIILTFLTFHNSFSQVNQEWVARYNGPRDSTDQATSIAVDGSGNLYVTGYSRGSGTYDDYATVKYNSSGVQQWVQRYSGSGYSEDIATSIAVDGSGNVYVTGKSIGSGTYTDYVTIKYNSSGVQQWAARYNGPGNSYDLATSLALDGSGNVYVTGSSYVSGNNSDYTTIKYNSSGDSVWVKRYNGPGNGSDYANSIAADNSGNVFVTGQSYGIGTDVDYATIKYNSAGAEQWVNRYNGTANSADNAVALALDGSGNIYVTGLSYAIGTYDDYATIKYNSSGDSVWVKRYTGPGNSYDYASSIEVDGSGNVYVTGYSPGSGGGDEYATIKYNSSGDSVWVKRYTGSANFSRATSIAVDGSGNIYVTGYSWSIETYDDYATIKYNSSGDSVWVKKYNGPGNRSDEAASIAVDGSGNVYVTGSSNGSGTGYDYATIKYSHSIGITQLSSEIPEQFGLSQNYPNPFNPITNLEFGISDLPTRNENSSDNNNTGGGFVSLKVYDILGKEIITLVNEKLSPGNYKVEFDGSALPSGVYFYRLTAGEITDTKRMMLVK